MSKNAEKKTYSKTNIKNTMSNNDYIQILNFYKIPIPESKKKIHLEAEKILALKLCKCIKKVDNLSNKNESRSIGICTKTIFNNKGLTRGKFKCKGKRNISFNKTKRNKKLVLS
jgi:hypothetical protein